MKALQQGHIFSRMDEGDENLDIYILQSKTWIVQNEPQTINTSCWDLSKLLVMPPYGLLFSKKYMNQGIHSFIRDASKRGPFFRLETCIAYICKSIF